MSEAINMDKAAPADEEKTIYDELPDAPPKKRLRLSIVGKISVAIVCFWVLMAFIGPYITPHSESAPIEWRAISNEQVQRDVPAEGVQFKGTAEGKTVIEYSAVGKDISGVAEFEWEETVIFTAPEPGKYDLNVTVYEELFESYMLPDSSISSYLGTDGLNRDVLSRIIWGARTTIGISFSATLLAYAVGITLGIAAAVAGGWTDTVLSRVIDAILAFPNIMLGLIVVAAVGSSIPLLIVLAGLIYAASVFRIARALGQDIMVQDYVEAARARGEGLWWIISREILPNAAMPLATDFGLRLIYIILFISALSFLGLGVQPPMADWGSMVSENRTVVPQGFAGGALAALAPAFAIASLTIAINLIVDDISAQSGGSLAKKMV